MSTKYTVSFYPANVSVSDERETVPGAGVTVEIIESSEPEEDLNGFFRVDGAVIPPEGDGVDCWCFVQGAPRSLPNELIDALSDAAARGSRGESGSLTVTVEI